MRPSRAPRRPQPASTRGCRSDAGQAPSRNGHLRQHGGRRRCHAVQRCRRWIVGPRRCMRVVGLSMNVEFVGKSEIAEQVT